MRNVFVSLALLFASWGLAVSAQEKSDERRSTTQMSAVERRMVEIELEVQLKTYGKILMALHEAEIDRAFMNLDDSATDDERNALQIRIKLWQNLKETAVLKSLKLEEKVSKAERIAVLESQLKTRLEFEQLLTRRYKDGTNDLDAKLIATADRLEAEIALLREKAKL